MSRITKWKLEKTKVKVVFRLQFHATHIPQSGWDKLFISFIPVDSGKATAKTTKANVRNATCKWADPIYETTRLLQDIRTKKFDEKLYKLVVAMGSSRSSVLGEATINLSDYVDALKPLIAAVPLHGCDSGAILHVTVQLLTSKTGFREFEQQREHRERGFLTDQNSPDESSGGKELSSEDIIDQMDKVNARVRLKEKSKDLISIEEEVGPIEDYDSAAGFDGSSNTSGSLYAEKNDTSSTHELESLKSTISGDLSGLCLTQIPHLEKGNPSDHNYIVQGTSALIHGWNSDSSADLATIFEENNHLRGSLEGAESSILELKLEVSSLQSHADQIGYEAQRLSRRLVEEIASGQDVAKEVTVLKSECLKLKDDLEQVKVAKSYPPFTTREEAMSKPQDVQLEWLKGLLIMEGKIRELQNKACFGYHESDYRSLQLGLEELLGTMQNLKQRSGLEISNFNLVFSEGASMKEIREVDSKNNGQFLGGTDHNRDLLQPEVDMLHCLSLPDLVSHEVDAVSSTDALRGKVFELMRELDESKTEQESLAKKMVQMECYYEALVQELEENQRRMLAELQNLRNEQSSYLYTISTTKAEMETMHQNLNAEILRLSKEKLDLGSLNQELERRASTAESALKRARLNYSIAVDQLQKDLQLLSFQVLSMSETNENLIRKAFVNSSQPSFEGHQEISESQVSNSGEHTVKLSPTPNHYAGIKKSQLGGDIFFDDLKRSLHLQEGIYQKFEEEVREMHSVNMYLDVLSNALQETLLEAGDDVRLTKERTMQLMQELELSTESNELLKQKLKKSMDEVHSLNEFKDICIKKCDEVALQNQILESNIHHITNENHLLMQKVADWESLVMQYSSYERKYETCAEEKTELAYLLEKKIVEHGNLQNENIALKEELITVKSELHELASAKENLQNCCNFLQNKLQTLMVAYDRIINELPCLSASCSQEAPSGDLASILLQLEELQHNSCNRILQLVEEKKNLEHERDISSAAAELEIVQMKKKFDHDIRSAVDKLDVSNASVQKLQLDIEAVVSRLKASSEVEKKHSEKHEELFSYLDRLETELQKLALKNEELAQEILALEAVTSELGSSKMNAAEIAQKNQDLMMSLQDKNVEYAKLELEWETLKKCSQSLHDENQNLKNKIEESSQLALDLTKLKDSWLSMQDENKALALSLQFKTEESGKLASELNRLKERMQVLQDENRVLILSAKDKSMDYAKLSLELNNLKESLLSLQDENQILMATSRDKAEESAKLASELKMLMENVESLHDEKQALTASSQDKIKEITELTSELNRTKDVLRFLRVENQALMASSQEKSEDSTKLVSELNSLRESLQFLRDENQALKASSQDKTVECGQLELELKIVKEQLETLHEEVEDGRDLIVRLKSTVTDLTSQLDEKQCQLLHFAQHESELVQHKELVSDLQSENERIGQLLTQHEKCIKNLREESCSFSVLESWLLEVYQLFIFSDVQLIFSKCQYETRIEELVQEIHSLGIQLVELQKKHVDAEISLRSCLSSETKHAEDNLSLLTSLNFLKSELDAANSEKRLLIETNRLTRAEIEEFKNKTDNVGLNRSGDRSVHFDEVERMKAMLVSYEEEIDNLLILREESEIKVIVLKGKLNEQQNYVISLGECSDEIVALQKQCNELTKRLSEQILKTEEFKNLSVHLKELKDKADEEYNHQKRETEKPPVAMQDSLRIAFIKEQYEGRLQELKQQLSISKKHSEEMLWKLQDAVDEVENRKKCEASYLKKNEELGMRIMELESELQSILSEKREKVNAYDLMKAEMECSLISLECCKEEKKNLETLLHECEEEKSKLAVELTLIKKLIKNSKSTKNTVEDKNCPSCKVDCVPSGEDVLSNAHEKNSVLSCDGQTGEPTPMFLEQNITTNFGEPAISTSPREVDQSITPHNVQLEQDSLLSGSINGPQISVISKESLLHGDMKHLTLINDHFRVKSLKSSMDLLSNELERMKNENSLLSENDDDFDQKFPALQRELMQLEKANEELGSMFPLYNEFPGSGSALERVLALEIELAESLQAKKRSSFHFQSSFLKQHSDEEAVFKSFRDINELIKDMLETKERYTAMESELKEMHDRYSQLSLQFAEVEGERQKLMMTLKNVRASRKTQHLNHSSSASPGDYSL
ncbi:hypothetical protein K2173_027425 [Erythroxylum novogranatense]|uniref:C2 NT-type domain-containing protein n=1 Tax=Erythroxylum novogranatense TaxID=1862640 RepID=A0AAV8U2W2_9ROSI|nr:hypothetical protein K2173_027425 [Erythroxylum novogranatense]